MPVAISENDQAVLDALCHAADAHGPCPTNPMLMEGTGLSESKVKNAIIRLEMRGFIEVDSIRWSRSIRIMATGRCTDWTHQPISAPPAKVLKAADSRRLKIMDIIQKAADAEGAAPSNFEMGRVLCCAHETIARDLRALARMGMLIVESPGGGKRRITLTATGASTGWAGEVRGSHRSVPGKRRNDEPDVVEELPEAQHSIIPCSRLGCRDAVDHGRAYCADHEVANVTEWPVVDLGPVEEDLEA